MLITWEVRHATAAYACCYVSAYTMAEAREMVEAHGINPDRVNFIQL